MSIFPMEFIREHIYAIERLSFSYDLELITRKHNQNNKGPVKKQFDWFSKRRQTGAPSNWFSKHAKQSERIAN